MTYVATDCIERKNRLLRAIRSLVLSSEPLNSKNAYTYDQLKIIEYLVQLPFIFTRIDYHDLFGVDIDTVFSTTKYKPSYLYPKEIVDENTIKSVIEILTEQKDDLGLAEKAFLAIQETSIIPVEEKNGLKKLGAIFRGDEVVDLTEIPLLFKGKDSYEQLNVERLDVSFEDVEVVDVGKLEDIQTRVDYYNKRFSKPTAEEKLSLNRSTVVKRVAQENLAVADIAKQLLINKVRKYGDELTVAEIAGIAKALQGVQKVERVALGLGDIPRNAIEEHYDAVGTKDEVRSRLLENLTGEQLEQLAKLGKVLSAKR